MKITVKDSKVVTRSGKARATGREYTLREQSAFVALGDEVRRISLLLEADQAAYPPGEYLVLFDESCEVDRYGQLALRRLALKPVSAATPVRQAG